MSYEIVKGLKLKRDVKEVWINSASNNIRPCYYCKSELKGLSEIFKEQGEEAVIRVLLREYWGGNFQPGTENIYSKAVSYFTHQYPDIAYFSVGPIKHRELCTCPVEDLPKYLYSEDKKVQFIIKRRLEGHDVDPDSIYRPVLYTDKELEDMLYASYLEYKKRHKVKCRIKYLQLGPYNGLYIKSVTSRYRKYASFEGAKVFNSVEEAEVFINKHGIRTSTEIIKEA